METCSSVHVGPLLSRIQASAGLSQTVVICHQGYVCVEASPRNERYPRSYLQIRVYYITNPQVYLQ